MTQRQVLLAILQKRGYLVLWQDPYHPQFKVGSVTAQCGGEGFYLGLMEVRKRTTMKDFLAQQVMSRKLAPEHWKWGSPTETVKKNMKLKPIFWRVTRQAIG